MQVVEQAQTILFSQPTPSLEQVDEFASTVNRSERNRVELAALLEESPDKASELAIGLGYAILGRCKEAIEHLSKSKDSLVRNVYLGRCLRRAGRHDEALASFDKALSDKAASQQMAIEKAGTLIAAARLDEAREQLKALANFENVSADYHYTMGRLMEAQSLYAEAGKQYRTALELEPAHKGAMFRLGYICDIMGDEETAMEYYQQAAAQSPVHVSALLNLSVLYEDMAQYEKAYKCVQTVLNSYPNHPRAQLFAKDIASSMTMIHDDEKERKLDRRNKLLETPISDFELSVRSRNCLRKMNIRTLGDLLRISEAELLSYKNFGETSLREIRAILESKSLRLGMALEEKVELLDQYHMPDTDDMSDLLGKSIDDLALSVRARKCLERLGCTSLGELIAKTEAELLGCKNFGVTSLNEIKGKLADLGLSLRKLD